MKLKIGLLSIAIIGTVAWLAVGGVSESKAYFKTIPELSQMGDQAHAKRVKVTGYVRDGSIVRDGGTVQFTLVENEGTGPEGMNLKIVYTGADPLPDTLKGHAQAVADGKLADDGSFHATKIQAKCASKYEAAPPTVKPSNI